MCVGLCFTDDVSLAAYVQSIYIYRLPGRVLRFIKWLRWVGKHINYNLWNLRTSQPKPNLTPEKMAENVLNRLLIFVGWVVALGYDVCWFSCYCVKKQRKAHQFETIFQIGKWVSGTHLKVGNKTKKQSIMKETEVMDAYQHKKRGHSGAWHSTRNAKNHTTFQQCCRQDCVSYEYYVHVRLISVFSVISHAAARHKYLMHTPPVNPCGQHLREVFSVVSCTRDRCVFFCDACKNKKHERTLKTAEFWRPGNKKSMIWELM